ncbi:RAP protein, putative [Plasmodium knowlesi strain H]|uniref:RAP protein, putative n=3 Tax=Plasmodium knowlesi TaxID=5850 RepID=A0A5K1UGC4_PLAKH|nr:RAP protein, putative [Plasmodium knowlesi strain H]OTN64407.1 putative RAP protein [Plasmodium knowlesi]CAA9988995.1 RAP protein, putative [Plasmodium knowlesi strain H]SBO24839.1 RAP protein, putative [Plasmodium knowlesi strain H]SBO27581.1 RAP protein, putative [Plasmodium knowlesi strain H]VVS78469.1 RAP protein, putative [Plasmodium knowlesi strain H]|eukprot:XP_002261343.1 hypothetical protein, conserved in Plasmodium species [Plasmodium knowlesi strain H]
MTIGTKRLNALLSAYIGKKVQGIFVWSSSLKMLRRRGRFSYTTAYIPSGEKHIGENIPVEELKKYLCVEKIHSEDFKKIMTKCMQVNKDSDTRIEDLLLILILFTKFFPHFNKTYGDSLYHEICHNIFNSIKLKAHYLYTSKMLIHTMNILTNLQLIDNTLVFAFTNKCSYFIQHEEYQIEDLVHFLSIFSKIYLLKNDPKFMKLKTFNWVLIKNICNKLTYNFDRFFLTYNDYAYTHKLKKKIHEQIRNMQSEAKNSRLSSNCSIGASNRPDTLDPYAKRVKGGNCAHQIGADLGGRLPSSVSFLGSAPNSSTNEYFTDIPSATASHDVPSTKVGSVPNGATLNELWSDVSQLCFPQERHYLLDTLLSISRSLRDLKFSHMGLLNEVAHRLQSHFVGTTEGGVETCDDVNHAAYDECVQRGHVETARKIFHILQCHLYLQVDHHMLYKSILNTYKNHLSSVGNLVVLFFLLAKNKLFPSKTMHLFDAVFREKISQGQYDERDLSTLLHSYAMHKYREVSIIRLILSRLVPTCVNLHQGDHNDQEGFGFNLEKVPLSNGRSNEKVGSGKCREGTINRNALNCSVINPQTPNLILDLPGKVKILHSLFKLDIYEEALICDISRMINEDNINNLDHKELAKLLLAMCYFSIENTHAYNLIIKNLIKFDIILDNVYLTQLKICELALRTRHVPNVYDQLNEECIEYMSSIKAKEKEAEYYIKSDLQKEIKNFLLTFNLCMSEEVPLGPYDVDFVEEDPTFVRIPRNYLLRRDGQACIVSGGITQNCTNSNAHTFHQQGPTTKGHLPENDPPNGNPHKRKNKLIIEVNGEHHFYKNSKSYTALSKLKHKLLSDLGYTVINIPYFEWGQLKTNLDKKAYIKKLISDSLNFEVVNVLPINQKSEPLGKKEMAKVVSTIRQSKRKTDFLTDIAKFRGKNKLAFLKRKVKNL